MVEKAKSFKSKRYLKISMATQINLKMPKKLYSAAKRFGEAYGYRNMQELIYDSVREKVFERSEYDESFTDEEIELIDKILEKSTRKNKLIGENELRAALSK